MVRWEKAHQVSKMLLLPRLKMSLLTYTLNN